ncbi:MAG: DUF2807 domain-containing protein [Brevundimonas sp.]|nr:MAG: DUF2807 domain-containing protein [Brevundimonas sp.]
MIRTLLIIAGAAFVLALASVGGAFALGGRDLAQNNWSWTILSDEGDNIRVDRVRGGQPNDLGPMTSRTLAWAGGDTLTIDDSLDVAFVQGPANSVEIRGPKGLVDRVRIEDGRVFLAPGEERVVFGWNGNGPTGRAERDELRILITAASVSRFEANGSGELTITGYDQPSLKVGVSGSGSAQATGRTDALTVDVNGSGEAELANLIARTARVDVAGSGEAEINASDEAAVEISGSGDVSLTRRPARVTQQISGSGEVHGA